MAGSTGSGLKNNRASLTYSSPSNRKRLGVSLVVYPRRTSILACPTAQDSHQTGGSRSGFAEHRMAQFPPLGERLGQGWNRKMSKPLRHEKIATTSEIYGDLGLEAKRRIQQ